MPRTDMGLTSADLEEMTCHVPECGCPGDLVLLPRCHPRGGVTARYLKGRGLLELSCRQCEKFISLIKVAAPASVLQ